MMSNAFDNITYRKGASVIRMFESWVGDKKFRAGVTSYVKRYSYKNASVGDFLDSIASTGQPRLTRAFSTYLEQPGFPIDLRKPQLQRRPNAFSHPEALPACRLLG